MKVTQEFVVPVSMTSRDAFDWTGTFLRSGEHICKPDYAQYGFLYPVIRRVQDVC